MKQRATALNMRVWVDEFYKVPPSEPRKNTPHGPQHKGKGGKPRRW